MTSRTAPTSISDWLLNIFSCLPVNVRAASTQQHHDIIMQPSFSRPHYALHPSVRLSRAKRQLENGKIYNVQTYRKDHHVRSNWQNNFKVKRLKIKVTEKGNVKVAFGAHIREKYVSSCKAKTRMTLIPCCTLHPIQNAPQKQESQLSQRDRATPRVIQYFVKSIKITRDHSKCILK